MVNDRQANRVKIVFQKKIIGRIIPIHQNGKSFVHQLHSFTLVEMLVVIAIISILASLLVPSLQGALSQAKTTYCANNLHQVSMLTDSYTSDNTLCLPYANNPSCAWPWKSSSSGAANPLTKYLPPSFPAFDNRNSIFDCPVNSLPQSVCYDSSYSANSEFFAGISLAALSRRASSKIILAEGDPTTGFCPRGFNKDFVYFDVWPVGGTSGDYKLNKNAHQAKTNCLFFDYHVQDIALYAFDKPIRNMFVFPNSEM